MKLCRQGGGKGGGGGGKLVVQVLAQHIPHLAIGANCMMQSEEHVHETFILCRMLYVVEHCWYFWLDTAGYD